MTEQHPMTKMPVVLQLPGTESVVVRRDIEYAASDAGPLTLDLYRPPSSGSNRLPVVIFVTGYTDVGVPLMLGCKFKEMEIYISWGKLVAAEGMAAITFDSRQP